MRQYPGWRLLDSFVCKLLCFTICKHLLLTMYIAKISTRYYLKLCIGQLHNLMKQLMKKINDSLYLRMLIFLLIPGSSMNGNNTHGCGRETIDGGGLAEVHLVVTAIPLHVVVTAILGCLIRLQ